MLLIADSAFNDLEDIKNYYLQQGVGHIGEKLINDILNHIQVLQKHPEIGRVVPEFAEPKLRELIHQPFRIVYLQNDKNIILIRVWRSERLLKLPSFS